MLMRLYNLEPNFLIVGNFTNFGPNEERLIAEGLKLHQDNPHLKLALMNLAPLEAELDAVYPKDVLVVMIAQKYPEIDYFINYTFLDSEYPDQEDVYQSMNSLLNVQAILIDNATKFFHYEEINAHVLENVFSRANAHYFVHQDNPQVLPAQKKLGEGNVQAYQELTGANFYVWGRVVHGKRLGTKIGFPTTNLRVTDQLPLKPGVYYTKVTLPNDEHEYDSMTCYWITPKREHLVETTIFDFNRDIYNYYIKVEFIEFVRDVKKVADEVALKALLTADETQIRKMIKKA